MRAALSAERWRVIRQLVTESLMLAFVAAGAGIGDCLLGRGRGAGLLGDSVPRVDEIRVDPFVLGFTFVVSILTGLIFGLAPAWHSANRPPGRIEGRRSRRVGRKRRPETSRRPRRHGNRAGGLATRRRGASDSQLSPIHRSQPRLPDAHLLTMEISLPEKPYPDGAPVQAFFKQLTERVSAIPGVQAAGAVSQMPLSDSYSSGTVFVQESSAANLVRLPKFENRPLIKAYWRVATPGYFQAMADSTCARPVSRRCRLGGRAARSRR